MTFPIKDSLVIASTVLLIGIGSMAAPVFAQDDLSDESLDDMLDEVIVTAQRKAENVQDVPISMTVFSEEQIANANMTNASDLTTLTPSLTVDTRFGYENTSFAIRGFTQSLRTTASVATYFADVVAPRGQTSQTSGDGAGPGYLFDLQNVQVLKGPQGTLFGRNTTGGAILLTPQEPTDSFEGYVEGSLGNYDAQRLQAVVNVPLAETFRMRLGVDSNEREGHLDNVARSGIDTDNDGIINDLNADGVVDDLDYVRTPGTDKLGSSDYTAVRLSFLWDVVEGVENYTIFQYVDSKSTGYSASLFSCNPAGLLAGVTGFGPLCQAQLDRQSASGDNDAYDVASTIANPESTIEEKRVVNTTTWDATDDITVKNIFGYAHLETTNGSQVFGSDFRSTNPAFLGYQFGPGLSIQNANYPVTSQESYVEEVQVQGNSMDEHLDWQIGAYYENSRPDGYSGNNSVGFLFCDLSTMQGDPDNFRCYDPGNGSLGSVLVSKYKTEFLNKAVYGQATYDFTDEFSITLGLRYTMDEAEGHGIKYRYLYNGTGTRTSVVETPSNPKVESKEPTGMIDFTYRPAEDVMTYFKYTRGYRQGSVNLSADSGLDEHDPEFIDTYELGLKTSFSGPIPGQFNIAAFDNELEDMQLQFGYFSPTAGPTTAIVNAGKAVVRGVEMDLVLKLHEDVTLNLSYSHLDTELKSQLPLDDAQVAARIGAVPGTIFTSPIASEGDELPFAPKNTWVATLNYLLPVPADMGLISLGTTYTYIGTQRTAASIESIPPTGPIGDQPNPYDMLDSYELLNLNASWIGIYDSDFDVSLYATNVLDEEYETYRAGTNSAIGIEVRQFGLPRMYGMRLRYSFGG
jgi:outer membrane receptor protein involved in Fe transport